MKIIRLLFKSSGKNLFLAIIASVFTGASSMGVIGVINFAITNLQDIPVWLPWLFISLCLVLWISRFINWIMTTHLSQKIVYNLRLKLTKSILSCPLRNLEIVGSSKLLATLTGDIDSISNASIQLSQLTVNLAILIGVFAYLYWLSLWLFIMVFISFIVEFALYIFIQNKGIEYFQLNREIEDVLFANFHCVTEGTKELKLHRPRRNAFINQELKANAIKFRDSWIKAITIIGFGASLGTVLFFIPIGLILFVYPNLTTVSTSTISSYAIAVLFVIDPISQIANAIPQITQANVAFDKIESLGLSLSKQNTEPDFPTDNDFDSNWTSLKLVGVNCAYGGETDKHFFRLQDINLEFKPGEIVFIVGGNGSGKSTLVKLIVGLYVPDNGQVLFNDLLVNDENREWYRQKFSVVFYDFYLFDRFVGIDTVHEQEITNYLQLLEIDHKVTVKDGILSTTNLSQGQRKRLALLTAFLEDRPIYVFDEWASDQDPVFKEIFYTKLLPKLKSKGKTVITITHDDRYFQNCDRLIKLDYGRLA